MITSLSLPTKATAQAHSLLIVVLTSLLVGVAGAVAFPVSNSGVPLVIGPQVLLLCSIALGPKQALLMSLFYLLEGALGCPFFSYGRSGIVMLIGQSGGYLKGYPISSYVAATIWQQTSGTLFYRAGSALLMGSSLITACGCCYLAMLIGWQQALVQGIIPFIITDIYKVVGLAALLEGALRSKEYCLKK